jgi:excisionase family DNA binding protein
MLMGKSLLTTKEVAQELGISLRQAQRLISQGTLPAKKVGRDFMVEEIALKTIKRLPRGKPRQSNSNHDVPVPPKRPFSKVEDMPNEVTVRQAAEILGVGERRVRKLIERNRLFAYKAGRDHLVDLEDVKAFAVKKQTARSENEMYEALRDLWRSAYHDPELRPRYFAALDEWKAMTESE